MANPGTAGAAFVRFLAPVVVGVAAIVVSDATSLAVLGMNGGSSAP